MYRSVTSEAVPHVEAYTQCNTIHTPDLGAAARTKLHAHILTLFTSLILVMLCRMRRRCHQLRIHHTLDFRAAGDNGLACPHYTPCLEPNAG